MPAIIGPMKHYIIVYIATLVVMTLLDLTWIGGIAKGFYKARFGDLLEFHAIPGVLFYFIYALGVVVFVNGGTTAPWQTTLAVGAMFGFFAYGTYDLTNLATLKGWSLSLAVVDMAWGTVVTGVSGALGASLAAWLERSLST